MKLYLFIDNKINDFFLNPRFVSTEYFCDDSLIRIMEASRMLPPPPRRRRGIKGDDATTF